MVKQSLECCTFLYMCFIDFVKAFDIMNLLECKKVLSKVIRLINAINCSNSGREKSAPRLCLIGEFQPVSEIRHMPVTFAFSHTDLADILTEVKQYAASAGLSIDIPETNLIYRVRQITFFFGKCFKKNY